MTNYRMLGVEADADIDEVLVATHPAPLGTYIVYAHKDGTFDKTPVVLWGVLIDGTAVPITLSGVWDGVTNSNNFVLHADGLCSNYDRSWDSVDAAIAEMKAFDS